MEDKKPAVNTTEPAAVQKPVASSEDYEAKVASLEAEKNKLIEETANWKLAALKAKQAKKEESFVEETEEEKMQRVAMETITNSKLAELAREKDALLQKALKENKELKLAHSSKPAPTGVGAPAEGFTVQDTLITPEQHAAFKARGWTDKDIERYKKNLSRVTGGFGR